MIDKLFKKSLVNQKKQWHGVGCNWSSKEQLMWNDIEKQLLWESNQLIFNEQYEYGWLILIKVITWESKETLVWNGMQLVFKRAIDVEWYRKTVALGIKSINF